MPGREWSRRNFLKISAATGGALLLPVSWSAGPAFGATKISGPEYFAANGFTAPLRRPHRIDMTKGGTVQVDIVQFQQQVLAGLGKTTLWGYQFECHQPSWPGATIVAKQDRRMKIRWRNRLPRGLALPEGHLLPVDETLHMAMPEHTPQGGLPTVTHLHGSHVEAASDGDPEAWFTQHQAQKGPRWEKPVYLYDNDQEAGTLWYHDHTVGITRLNVYAGLAGMCLLRDDHELRLMAKGVLPAEKHEVELAVQDRWFDTEGGLHLDVSTNPDQPENGILATIFADCMVVNGTPWPYLDVEPRPYRFRLLNASDSRILVLRFDNPAAQFLRVGTDLGLSDEAVPVGRLVVAPAERYDLVVDFTGFAGQTLELRNDGLDGPLRGFRTGAGAVPVGQLPPPGVVTNNPQDAPFGFGPFNGPNPGSATGRVMQFRVGTKASHAPRATVVAGTRLRPRGGSLPELTPMNTRKVVLLTGNDEFNRVMEMQGTLEKRTMDHDAGTFAFFEPVTENPELGATEIWEIHNFTVPPVGLVHPIHLHLVHFQVLSREAFAVTDGTPANAWNVVRKDHPMHGGGVIPGGGRYLDPDLVQLSGAPRAPEAHEQGWKDTVIAYPGEVTRVVAKFDRPGRYVWHCHLLHHEDHEMMRPFVVGAMEPDPMEM
jgi:spore coat protein A